MKLIINFISEGDLGFDAFGNAQFSQLTKVIDWMHTYHTHDEDFLDVTANGGSITGVTSESSVVFSTSTVSGSYASRTSHQYIPYNPGEGNEILISFRCGDEGKANVVRQWGLFDDEDGLFFQLSGTEFSVNIRNSASGTPTDTKVVQTAMNGDSLDSANVSNYLLEFSKYNIYWLDYQWLGVGRVRFGTISPTGKRVTMHTFENPNQHTLPYMRKGALPLSLRQFNLDTASSTSEMRLICASILRQSHTVDFPGHYYSYTSPRTAISGSVFTPIMSSKPNTTHFGETNRVTLIPTDFEVVVEGDPVQVQVIANPALTGASYIHSGSTDSAFVIDTSATSYTGGSYKEALMLGSGVTHREIAEDLNNTLKLSADGVSQPVFSVMAKTINPAGNANVTVLFRWKETN